MDITNIDEKKIQEEIDIIQKKVLELLIKEDSADAQIILALQNIIITLFIANKTLSTDEALQGLEQIHEYSKMMVVASARTQENQKV